MSFYPCYIQREISNSDLVFGTLGEKRTWRKRARREVWMDHEMTMARQLFPWLLSYSLFDATIMIVQATDRHYGGRWSRVTELFLTKEHARRRKCEAIATTRTQRDARCDGDQHVCISSRLLLKRFSSEPFRSFECARRINQSLRCSQLRYIYDYDKSLRSNLPKIEHNIQTAAPARSYIKICTRISRLFRTLMLSSTKINGDIYHVLYENDNYILNRR